MKGSTININERIVIDYVTKNRPPIEIRDQLDLGCSCENNVIELFEIRPVWSKPGEYQNLSFAKIKYVRTQKIWKLFWMRATGKWQSYEPHPESSNLNDLLTIIDKDKYGCFRG